LNSEFIEDVVNGVEIVGIIVGGKEGDDNVGFILWLFELMAFDPFDEEESCLEACELLED
jgi:hypothetical protein